MPLSAYFLLSPEKRESRKAEARNKYRGPAGEMQKRKQYMKYLQAGIIRHAEASTLARHGIVYENGEYRFNDGLPPGV